MDEKLSELMWKTDDMSFFKRMFLYIRSDVSNIEKILKEMHELSQNQTKLLEEIRDLLKNKNEQNPNP